MLSDDDMDDDYIPESLRGFLMEADAALSAHTQMFMNELDDSPTAEAAAAASHDDYYDHSNLDDLRSNMEKVSLLDQHTRAYNNGCHNVDTASDDDSDYLSPTAANHNPAANMTFSEVKRNVLGASTTPTEEKKQAPFGNEEDFLQADPPASPKPPSPEKFNPNGHNHTDDSGKSPQASSLPEVKSTLTEIASAEEPPAPNLEAPAPSGSLGSTPFGSFSYTPGDNNNNETEDSTVEAEKENAEQQQQAEVVTTEEKAAVSPFGLLLSTDENGAGPEPSPEETPNNSAAVSHFDADLAAASTEERDSPPKPQTTTPGDAIFGAPSYASALSQEQEEPTTAFFKPSPETANGKDHFSFGTGNPGNSLESGEQKPTAARSEEEKELETPSPPPSRDTKMDDKKVEVKESDPVAEKPQDAPVPQQESRSLFGAFSSFARSVVSSNKPTSQPKTSPPRSTSNSPKALPPAEEKPSSPPIPAPPSKEDSFVDAREQVSPRHAASPTPSLSSTEDMMQNMPSARIVSHESEEPQPGKVGLWPIASPTPSLSSTEDMMQKGPPAIGNNGEEFLSLETELAMAGKMVPEMTIEKVAEAPPMGTAPSEEVMAAEPSTSIESPSKAPEEMAIDSSMEIEKEPDPSMEAEPAIVAPGITPVQPAPAPVPAPVPVPAPAVQDEVMDPAIDAETKENKMAVEASTPPKVVNVSSSPSPEVYTGGSITSHGSLAKRSDTKEPAKNTAAKVPLGKSPTPRPLISPTSRLMKPTTASRLHTHSTEKRALSTPASKTASSRYTPSTGKRSIPTPTRIPVPTTVRITTTSTEKKRPSTTTPVSAKSRFMQPTVAQRNHTVESAGAKKPATSATKRTGGVSSRLTMGTSASKAKVSSSPHPNLPQKRGVPNDAVARARERVRLRKLEEAKKSSFQAVGNPKFNVGTKPKEKPKPKSGSPRFATPTSSTIAHQEAEKLSLAKSAVFFGRIIRDESQSTPTSTASARRRGLTKPEAPKFSTTTNTRSTTSRLTKPTSCSRARAPVIPMAQSTDFFGRGLRSDSSPPSKAPRQGLTIPQGPKFATTTRIGSTNNKRPHTGSKTVSLAQSSNLLANTLRGYDAVQPSKGPTRLTRPQAPKFHTTHKRALPKSSAELEAEKMTNFKARPFRAVPKPVHTTPNQNPLHTGSSAGLTKVAKRTLTRPEPFKLSSGSRSTRLKPTPSAETVGSKEGTTQFRARPVPATSAPRAKVDTQTKRTLTSPQPFKFAVDMKSKAGSPSRHKASQSSSPKLFKARPLPKSTFKGPSIPVHQLTSPQKENAKKEVSCNENKGFVAREYKGPPPPPASTKSPKSPTTPEPFRLESEKRHDAFQELLQEKIATEEEEFRRNLCTKALPLPKSTYKPDI